MNLFSDPTLRAAEAEKFTFSTRESDSIISPLSEITSRSTQSKSRMTHVHRPWRHSVSHHILSSDSPPSSSTVREYQPGRQRIRLFVAAFAQWLCTALFCALLAVFLWGFAQLDLMKVWQVKMFNALMVLASMWLGTNLTSSLREYAMMMRWRILAMKHRSLREMDLIMQCDSLRAVIKLFFTAKCSHGWGPSKTQIGCLIWVAINLALAVLVALLGLTYNLATAEYPELKYGLISTVNLSLVRDIWGVEDPSYAAQLGAANGFGIQGQDYNFTDGPVPGQTGPTTYGSPMTPNIYAFDNWAEMRYFFMDLNPDNPNLSILTKRSVGVQATCEQLPVLSGGNGISPYVEFLDTNNVTTILDAVRVGPGATTYISMLNSTCGPRCTELFVLQSANNDTIPEPGFFRCNNTVSTTSGIDEYIQSNQTSDLYELPDQQAQIFAGAIGWTGFNFSAEDQYQYVRYPPDSWWSPYEPSNATKTAEHIMEFAIEAIAALDNNGPRTDVAGWYPITAQRVSVNWRWAATLLSVIPALHALAMVGVVLWAGEVVIRDESCLSVARLLRPVVEKLGPHGCLLTGQEIAESLEDVRVRYGVEGWEDQGGEEDEVRQGLRFENAIVGGRVRHVGMLEQGTGRDAVVEVRRRAMKKRFPAGLYDGVAEVRAPPDLHRTSGRRRKIVVRKFKRKWRSGSLKEE
ncbi:uncharacterized protein HMPREF1541_01111 [Cyphellophora europaea CBS 101466]|uniref:Uncharacterized protein n=1 Tax=Cyphellophora europaea (strain CBS 101466) TaxID=1220924 RepID=W2SE18_CYPE1|nr:uncharacterized protein HMPREF1541_01111 [Cyphellophora europaea CBS 101466]ETN46922.1 hypothetical protein HMPREF1541_01111 [Cyphellophora europaea CBS 101466]